MEEQIAAYYAAARKNARENAAAEDADFSKDDGQWEDSGIGGEATPASIISTPESEQGSSARVAAASGGMAGKHDDDDDEDEEFGDV